MLGRPKFRTIFERADLDVRDIVAWLALHATIVLPKPLPRRVVIQDPSDDLILACGVTAGVHFIVTGDQRHLLSLGSYDRIRICSPSEYLKIVEGNS